MSGDKIVTDCEQQMDKRIKTFDGELAKVRTGRASIAILDKVRVDYYGNPAPLKQVANLSTPDARTIAIAPFEKNLIAEIEKAILKADIGYTPTNDGNIVRIPIPALSEDRRKDIAKELKKIGEDAKVNIRQIRKNANDAIKVVEKDKKITEDDSKRLLDKIQKSTDKFIKVLDDKILAKEKEVMKV